MEPQKKRVRIREPEEKEEEEEDADLLEPVKRRRKEFTHFDSDSESETEAVQETNEINDEAVDEALSIPAHENTGQVPIIPYSMAEDLESG